jgi:PadR family transcriptional regulator, regulatory protein AphA
MPNELSPQYALLGFLYFQPLHGYDLHKRLEANLHELWHISQSQTYNILKRLDKDGWIASTLQPQEKLPDRSCYTLTDLGKGQFEKWMGTPTRCSVRAIRIEFLTRLFFASQIDEDTCWRLLQEQVAYTRRNLDRLQNRLGLLPPGQTFNRLGLELRIHQLITTLDWLEACEPGLWSAE